MNGGIKNISKQEILELKKQVGYLEHQVVSKTLVQNAYVSMTLFAFDKEEEISTHTSTGDAFVLCLDGKGEITVDDETFFLVEGQSIVMPSELPHSVYGVEKFKMLLVVVFPTEK